jgi:hypothetical protein
VSLFPVYSFRAERRKDKLLRKGNCNAMFVTSNYPCRKKHKPCVHNYKGTDLGSVSFGIASVQGVTMTKECDAMRIMWSISCLLRNHSMLCIIAYKLIYELIYNNNMICSTSRL